MHNIFLSSAEPLCKIGSEVVHVGSHGMASVFVLSYELEYRLIL